MRRPHALVVMTMLFSTLCAGVHAKAASVDDVAGETRGAPRGPWWQSFRELPLAALQEQARSNAARTGASAGDLDLEVTAAYIGARSLNVRALLADEMLQSIEQQRRLAAGTAPLRKSEPALVGLDMQHANVERFANDLRARRDERIDTLARLCGAPADTLREQLAQALADRTMPVFDAPLPASLPSDIRDESRAGLNVLAAWDAQQVGSELSDLQTLNDETAKWAEVVRTRQVEFEAARRRMALGVATEYEVVTTYQLLLGDNDRLARAGAELAHAWMQLQASTGGRALQASGSAQD